MSDYYSISRDWQGETVVCIASGPSLTDADVEKVRKAHAQGKCKVIVVNDNYLKAPWADHLHFCDAKWYEWHHRKEEFKSFTNVITTLADNVPDSRVKRLCKGEQKGLSALPDTINHGSNSGYQAVNIAVLRGAKKIVLLGYDMQGQKTDKDIKMHWFGDHKIKTPPAVCNIWLDCWPSAKECLDFLEIKVIQATRETSLDIFPRQSIGAALCG